MLKNYFNLKKVIATTILLAGFSAGTAFAQETEAGIATNGIRRATRSLCGGESNEQTREHRKPPLQQQQKPEHKRQASGDRYEPDKYFSPHLQRVIKHTQHIAYILKYICN